MAVQLHSLPTDTRDTEVERFRPIVTRIPSRTQESDIWALSTFGSALLHALVIAPVLYLGAKALDSDVRYEPPPRDSAPMVTSAVKMSDFDKPKPEPKPPEPKIEPPKPKPEPKKVVEAKPEPKPDPKKKTKKRPARKTAKKRVVKRKKVEDKAPDGRAQRILSKGDKPAPNGPSPSDLEKAGSGAVGDGPPPAKVAGDPKGTKDGIGSEPANPPAPAIDVKKLLRKYLKKVARAVRKDFKYPRAAIRAGMEGRAVVAIMIDEEGRVISAKLSTSSGYDILDDAAVKAAKSISKVPKAPAELEWSKRRVKIPFKFRLRT